MVKTKWKRLIMPLGLGLCIASVLVGCGSGENTDTPAAPPTTVSSAPEVPTVAPPVPVTPATKLDVNVSAGSITVSLNGRKVGDYPSAIEIDVAPYVKAGQNTLKIDWTDDTSGTAKIEYALAATPENYKDIAKFNLFNAEGKKAGSRTLAFNLPNADGTLAAPDETLTIEPTTAPQAGEATPVAPETSTTAETPVASGVKAIMSVSANDAPIEISLNGTKIGDYQAYLKTDVGRYLKVGSNTLDVAWKSKTYFNVKIAYFSSVANDYRDISKLTLYQTDTAKPGTRKITFMVPES